MKKEKMAEKAKNLIQGLYDHRSDPVEEDNLVVREPEVVKLLEALVAEHPSVKK